MNRSYSEMYGLDCPVDLNLAIDIPLNILNSNDDYKCRIIYGRSIEDISYSKYTPKFPSSIKVVHHNSIDYHLKYSNRDEINSLLDKSHSDEILIIKEGLVTDTSKYNVCFFNGQRWFTPSTPLLKGIMREALIEKGIISEIKIKKEDLAGFTHFVLINALNPFNPSNAFTIKSLRT